MLLLLSLASFQNEFPVSKSALKALAVVDALHRYLMLVSVLLATHHELLSPRRDDITLVY
jgi:hypothetical protein